MPLVYQKSNYKSGTLWTEMGGILCCEISGIL